MKVFVDTGAWLAIEMDKDVSHKVAKEYWRVLRKQKARLFTNDYVLAETITRLIYDVHLSAANDFWKKVRVGREVNLQLIEIGPKERDQAWEVLEKYRDHKLSFTDATIVANFKTHGLDEVFTFDKHFKEANIPTN